jgi:hypothetical protein
MNQELLARADKATRDMTRLAGMIRMVSEGNLPLARQQLEAASAELARYERLRRELEPRKDHPTGAYHDRNIALMCTIQWNLKRGAERVFELCSQNVEMLGDPDADYTAVRVPGRDPIFLETRCRLEVALGTFHWIRNANAIDALLRAFCREQIVTPQSAEEEATRAAWAEQLKEAAKADRTLFLRLTTLAAELQETRAYLVWAKDALERLDALSGEARAAVVRDADWGKLYAKIAQLNALDEHVAGQPMLARIFTEPPAQAMA